MKLHLSDSAGINLIAAYGDGFVQVDATRHDRSLVVLPDRLVTGWPVPTFDQLAAVHLAQLIEYRPALVLLGTGRQHRMLHPSLARDLIAAGIGIEVMTTGAACRTYNILAGDGRGVAAALIIES